MISEITNVFIELLIHWLIFLPGLILFCLIIYGLFSLNIFLWIPLLIYFIYIQVKLPSFKEIDTWAELRENLNNKCYLKSEKYNESFKVDFEDSSELKPDNEPKLFVWHPHGIQVISHIVHKLWKKSPLHKYIKDSKTTVHSMTFQIPIIRELFLLYGCIPATKEYISHYLKNGISVNIFPGGVREMAYCIPENKDLQIYLRGRKGYLDVANGYSIIPIITVGEQEFFLDNTNTNNNFKKAINIVNKILGAISGYSVDISSLGLFTKDNFLKWNRVFFGKEKTNTYTYVGKSIKTDKSVEYIENLQRMYDNLKKNNKTTQKQELIIL